MEMLVGRVLAVLATLVDASTGLSIGLGVLTTIARLVKLSLKAGATVELAMGDVRLILGRWLALSLELALAADILRTVMVPTWDEIGKLAAIVLLRTILNYFLGREIEQEQKKKEDYVLSSVA